MDFKKLLGNVNPVENIDESYDFKLTKAYFHKKSGKWIRQKRAVDDKGVEDVVPSKERDDTPTQIKECDCQTFKQFFNTFDNPENLEPLALDDPAVYADSHVSDKDLEGTGLAMQDIHDIHHEIESSTPEDLLSKWEDEMLDEGLDAGGRLKAKARFSRTAKARNTKKAMVMSKPADVNRLQNRAVNMARRMIMAKILRGRQKSSLSPSEKTNLEQRLKNSQGLIRKIAVRVFPKVKAIDRNRLTHRT